MLFRSPGIRYGHRRTRESSKIIGYMQEMGTAKNQHVSTFAHGCLRRWSDGIKTLSGSGCQELPFYKLYQSAVTVAHDPAVRGPTCSQPGQIRRCRGSGCSHHRNAPGACHGRSRFYGWHGTYHRNVGKSSTYIAYRVLCRRIARHDDGTRVLFQYERTDSAYSQRRHFVPRLDTVRKTSAIRKVNKALTRQDMSGGGQVRQAADA